MRHRGLYMKPRLESSRCSGRTYLSQEIVDRIGGERREVKVVTVSFIDGDDYIVFAFLHTCPTVDD